MLSYYWSASILPSVKGVHPISSWKWLHLVTRQTYFQSWSRTGDVKSSGKTVASSRSRPVLCSGVLENTNRHKGSIFISQRPRAPFSSTDRSQPHGNCLLTSDFPLAPQAESIKGTISQNQTTTELGGGLLFGTAGQTQPCMSVCSVCCKWGTFQHPQLLQDVAAFWNFTPAGHWK